MNEFLKIANTPIEYLKGVGPSRGELLRTELEIRTFADLLTHYPYRYVDRTRFYKINEIQAELHSDIQIVGRLSAIKEVSGKRGKRLTALFADETGSIELVWFKGLRWIKSSLQQGANYVLFGKPTLYMGKWNVSHPEMELLSEFQKKGQNRHQAVYSSTEKLTQKGLHSRGLARLMEDLWPHFLHKIPENLPPSIINRFKLIPLHEALKAIHFPENEEILKRAQLRLKFDEFFFVQLGLVKQRLLHKQKVKGFVMEKVGEQFYDFYEKHLPFELTNAQKRVVKEIRINMASGAQMNRLVQGDVGSGKTIVALLSMLIALDNGFQCCLMAPTEILATQHYDGIADLLKSAGIEVELLTGSTKKAKRTIIHEKLESGALKILIGTHALLEEKVAFANLGLAIIDEQHRFGVAQRARLWQKNILPPHILVMTATPIPRTLAMSLYGDLDISVIDELPPGRKPIKTLHYYENKRLALIGFLKEEIKKGRQIYVVYPLIEESEKMDYQNLQDGFEALIRDFPAPEYQVSIVHGRMKAVDKRREMELFVQGKTHIMVATTVIEVGVNVPNASVMVIESAERFGLSQLHQLRGRVGRGADQSYCILMSGFKISKEGKTRLQTMVETNDGFAIAEADLKLRGPGELSGTRQSGLMNFKIADLVRDGAILKAARAAAIDLLDEDPGLDKADHQLVKQWFLHSQQNKLGWGRIS